MASDAPTTAAPVAWAKTFESILAHYIETARSVVGSNGKTAEMVVLSDAALPGAHDRSLYVGGWCRGSRRNTPTLPNPVDDRRLVRPLEQVAWDLRARMLARLTPSLNELHGTSHAVLYWNLFLGLWMLDTASVVIDRFLRCAAAHQIAPDARFVVAAPLDPPRTQAEGLRRHVTDRGNADLMGCLVEALGYPTLSAHLVAPEDRQAGPAMSASSPVGSIADAVAHWATGAAIARGKERIVLLGYSQLRNSDLLRLRRRVAGLTLGTRAGLRHRLDWLEHDISPDIEKRSRLTAGKPDAVLEAVLAKSLSRSIPLSAIEGYEYVVAESHRRYGASADAVHGNYSHAEPENEFLARSRLSGKKIVFAQHGGSYRQALVNPVERLEIGDGCLFLSWGGTGAGVRAASSPHLARLKDRHRGGSRVLLVELLLPRYLQRFWSGPLAEQTDEIGTQLARFVHAITAPHVARQLVVKRSIAGHIYAADRHPEIARLPHTGDGSRRAPYWMQRSRLVIVTYPDTTFIEAMVMNAPTIGLWNPDYFEMTADAAAFFDALAEQGVIFSDPAGAARQLERVYDFAGGWWAAEGIQSARHKFIERFGRSGDWVGEWGALLNEWRSGPDPGDTILNGA